MEPILLNQVEGGIFTIKFPVSSTTFTNLFAVIKGWTIETIFKSVGRQLNEIRFQPEVREIFWVISDKPVKLVL